MKTKDYATIIGAAKMYNLPPQTVRNWIATGRLAVCETADGVPLIRLADLRRAMKNRPKRGRPRKEDKHKP